MLEFSAPGVCATSYTRTLSFSSSTFGLTVALAAFSCATAEFVMLPAIMNAGTTIPTKNPSDFCRSEEHTSELQSRQYLVCRLLLEKKKKKKKDSNRS